MRLPALAGSSTWTQSYQASARVHHSFRGEVGCASFIMLKLLFMHCLTISQSLLRQQLDTCCCKCVSPACDLLPGSSVAGPIAVAGPGSLFLGAGSLVQGGEETANWAAATGTAGADLGKPSAAADAVQRGGGGGDGQPAADAAVSEDLHAGIAKLARVMLKGTPVRLPHPMLHINQYSERCGMRLLLLPGAIHCSDALPAGVYACTTVPGRAWPRLNRYRGCYRCCR